MNDTGKDVRILSMRGDKVHDHVQFPYVLKKDGSPNHNFIFWLNLALKDCDEVRITLQERL